MVLGLKLRDAENAKPLMLDAKTRGKHSGVKISGFCSTCLQAGTDNDQDLLPEISPVKWAKLNLDEDKVRCICTGYECYKCFDVRRRNLRTKEEEMPTQDQVNEWQDSDPDFEADVSRLRRMNVRGETAYKREYELLKQPEEKVVEEKSAYTDDYVEEMMIPIKDFLKGWKSKYPAIENLASVEEMRVFCEKVLEQEVEAVPAGSRTFFVVQGTQPKGTFKRKRGVKEATKHVRSETHADSELSKEHWEDKTASVRRRIFEKTPTPPSMAVKLADVPMELLFGPGPAGESDEHGDQLSARLATAGLCHPTPGLPSQPGPKTGDDSAVDDVAPPPPASAPSVSDSVRGADTLSATGCPGSAVPASASATTKASAEATSSKQKRLRLNKKGYSLEHSLGLAEELLKTHDREWSSAEQWNDGAVIRDRSVKQQSRALTSASAYLAGVQGGTPEELQRAADLAQKLYDTAEELTEMSVVMNHLKNLTVELVSTPLTDAQTRTLRRMPDELLTSIVHHIMLGLAARVETEENFADLLLAIYCGTASDAPAQAKCLTLTFLRSSTESESKLSARSTIAAVQNNTLQVLVDKMMTKLSPHQIQQILDRAGKLVPRPQILPDQASLASGDLHHGGWTATCYADLCACSILTYFAAAGNSDGAKLLPAMRRSALEYEKRFSMVSLKLKALQKLGRSYKRASLHCVSMSPE